MYLKRIIALSVLLIAIYCQAQDYQKTNSNAGSIPASQSAMSLAKMSQATINRSTGTAEISYPAGTLQGKSLSVPVTFVYDASGRKVKEEDGDIGWGWGMMAGGTIVRNIVGQYDEFRCVNTDLHPNTDTDSDGNFEWAQWNNSYGVWVSGIPDNFDPGGEHADVARDVYYFQPDEFVFTLPDGRSGTFVINEDHEVVLIPYMALKIHFEEHLYGFTITDDAGVKYIFNTRSVSYTTSPTSDNTYDNQDTNEAGTFTAWYLDEIQNASGEIEFTFEYNDKGFEQTEETYWSTKYFSHPDVPLAYMYAFDDLTTTYVSHVQKKRLVNITSSLGSSVDFGYPDDDDLELVSFKDFGGFELYHLDLNKGVFNAQNPQDDRLKLTSISLKDADSSIEQVTSFEYNDNGGLPFPAKNSNARDHWGYYNGLIEPGLRIPSVNGTIRRVDPDYSQMGILTSVSNPNGGVIHYEYETNTYSSSPDGTVSLSSNDLSTSRIAGCTSQVQEEEFYELDDNSNWEFSGCDCTTAWNGHLDLCCYVQMEQSHCDYGYTFYNPDLHFENNEAGSDNVFELNDDDDVDHPWNPNNEDDVSLETIYSPNIKTKSNNSSFFIEFDQTASLNGSITKSKWSSHLNYIQIKDAQNNIVWEEMSSISGDQMIAEELELNRGLYTITTKVYYPLFSEVEQFNNEQIVFPMNSLIREDEMATISVNYEVKSIYPSAFEKFGGGLRVSQTIVSDGDIDPSNNTYTKYTYDAFSTGHSSGYLLSDPKYECHIPYFFSFIKGCSNDDPCFQSDFTFYSDAGVNQIVTANGSYVLYSNVRTEQCSSTGCDNGWIEEEFTIHGSSNSSPIFNNKTQYKKWRSGLPLATRMFKESGDKISEVTNTYEQIIPSPSIVKSLFAGLISVTHHSHNLGINCGNVDFPCGGTNPDIIYDGLSVEYVSEMYSLISTTTKTYDQTNQSKWMESTTTYEFNSEMIGLPSRILTQTNDPDYPYHGEIIKYVADYDVISQGDDMTSALNYLLNTAHIGSGITVETVELKGSSPTTMFVVGGSMTTFKLSMNHVVQDAVYNLELPHVMQETSYMQSFVDVDEFEFNTYYRRISHASEYNQDGQVLCAQVENDIPRTYIRDYEDGRVVSDILNATPLECAYTSFETSNGGGWTYPVGSSAYIEFAHLGFMLPYARTGRYSYYMDGEEISKNVTAGLYTLSFWSMGDVVTISGNGITTSERVIEEYACQGWDYYEYQIDVQTEDTTELIISSTSARIDELRFYPFDAHMKTTTYNTDGSIAATCNENNFCTYFLYDALKRQEWILDDQYQIVSHHVYHVKDSNEILDFTWQKDQVILEEYITKSEVENAGAGNSNVRSTITYSDGLGRVIETVGVRTSPNGRDMITFRQYDAYGREPRAYATCTADIGNDGDFIPIVDLMDRQQEFYSNTAKVVHTDYPYAEVEYESSPANRILKQGHLGETWQITSAQGVIGGDHVVKTQHLLNDANEVLNWGRKTSEYTAMSVGTPSIPVYYPANSLIKTKMVDEEDRISYEYQNQYGQVICKRVEMMIIGSGEDLFTHHDGIGEYSDLLQTYKEGEIPWGINLDSYYIYDDFGRMIFEIPAIAVSHCNGDYTISVLPTGTNYSIFQGYTTSHGYDQRSRLILEKKPGEDWTEYVYNDLNKLVMLKSPELAAGHWKFIKYDIQGREIQTGIVEDNQTRSALQNYFDQNSPILWETKPSGTLIYTNVAYPEIAESDVLTEMFYDNYEFDLNGYDFASLGLEEVQSLRTHGFVTGARTQVFDGSTQPHFLTSVTYFDMKGRDLISIEENLLEGCDKIQYYFDYAGKLTDTKKTHLKAPGADELIILNYFEYDHMGRSKLTWQKTGDDQWVALNKLVYNELGQVVNKHIHLTSLSNTGMQIIDYRYNERGWLTKINNADLANDGDNDQAYDVFGEELIYFEEDRFESDDMNMIPKFDGNIGAMKWKTNMTFTGDPADMEDGTQLAGHSYVFRYDDLGQLVGSYYASSSDVDPCNYTYRKHLWDEKTNYDINGNILKMRRWREVNGVKTASDVLTMGYITDSNKLLSVNDGGNDNWELGYSHFVDNTGGNDYEYDDEGRVTVDNNKHFEYSYNHLDLVSEVNFEGESVVFIWDAIGRKHAKLLNGQTTYYLGGIEYLDTELKFIATAEGIVRHSEIPGNEEDWVYDYYLLDHLGNTRAVITEEQSELVTEKVTNEIAKRLEEEEAFDNVGQTAETAPYFYPYDPDHPNNAFVNELNAYGGEIIGPAKLLAVEEGEQIDLSTKYWYQELPSENPITDLSEILAGVLLNMGVAANGVIPAGPETGMALLNNVSGAPFSALNSFLDEAFEEVDLSLPQAYLVYMFFDEATMTIEPKKSGIVQVGEANELGVLTKSELVMSKDGFFYVYVTNRSHLSVNFDNLTVKRWKPMVRASYDYYPYGLTWRNPAEPGIDNDLHDCTYQNKEFQFGEFGDGVGLMLYDFHARMYDGTIGRWMVPDPATQFANPYLAMANCPINLIDPDGTWTISSFLDNHDYEWQKRNLPLAIKFSSPFGTEQKGIGFDVSIGMPKNSVIGGRLNLGASYFNKNYHNPKGWETRFGVEANLGRFVSIGTMHYSSGETSQTTSVVQIGSGTNSFRYENDWMGGLPADQHDRFRTTGAILKLGGLKINLNMFTGSPGGPDSNKNPKAFYEGYDDGRYVDDKSIFGWRNDRDWVKIYKPHDGFDPDKYRDGVMSFQIGAFRIGRNSEAIRNAFQNQFAHDIILKGDVPHFRILDIKPKWSIQFANGNGNSTW